MNKIKATLNLLKNLRRLKDSGAVVFFTSDITWMVDMAINRRAGWMDDPSSSRGACRPVNGKYPKKAEGDTYGHLEQIARQVNTPRLIVRAGELGEWRRLIETRLPGRLFIEE